MRWILDTQRELSDPSRSSGTLGTDVTTACGEDVEKPDGQGHLDESQLIEAIAREPRPTPDGRPWLLANMVASADGAASGVEGRSASLSGPADRLLFAALRSIADIVLAGAGTVRAENYGAARLSPEAAAARAAREQDGPPRLAVVTGSLRLDPTARLFQEAQPEARPIVLTMSQALDAAPTTHDQLAKVADVRAVGEATVDWERAVRLLHDDYGARVVLVEGGPTVNAHLVDQDLLDELCLTVSPLLLGGSAQRIVANIPPIDPLKLRLDRAFEDEGFLFLRYVRPR